MNRREQQQKNGIDKCFVEQDLRIIYVVYVYVKK